MEKKVSFVQKRDGRIVPFDKDKISNAIFKAAQSLGGEDKYLAEDLAEVVRLYLVKEYKKDTPSVEDIQDIVERVLIKTGHARTAKAYILYREKRARIRRMREGVKPEDLITSERQSLIKNINLSVRESNDNISLWDKERIIDTLIKETGLQRNISELIVGEVEEEVVTSKITELSSSLIRELVNAKLVTYGFETERNKHTRLGVPVYDVNRFLSQGTDTPDILSLKLGRHIKKEFALLHVLPEKAVEKHLTGEIQIHNLEGIDKFFSATVPIENITPITENKTCLTYNYLKNFIEDKLVLSVSSEYISNINIPYADNPIIEIEPKRSATNIPNPSILRICSLTDLNSTDIIWNSIKSIEITTQNNFNRVVLNRVTTDLSFTKDKIDFTEDVKNFLHLCYNILQRQKTFIDNIYAERELPEIFKKSVNTIEIKLITKGEPNKKVINCLLHNLFHFPPVFSFKISFDKTAPLKPANIINLFKPFLDNKTQIRLYYV